MLSICPVGLWDKLLSSQDAQLFKLILERVLCIMSMTWLQTGLPPLLEKWNLLATLTPFLPHFSSACAVPSPPALFPWKRRVKAILLLKKQSKIIGREHDINSIHYSKLTVTFSWKTILELPATWD